MKVIVYDNNGTLAVVVPAIQDLDKILERSVPAGKEYRIIDASEIPNDRTFRNAWKYDKGITVDLNKAKEIHKEKLRKKRKPLLDALDVEFLVALENSGSTEEIIARKKFLRDITKATEIENASSVEELKNFNPI